MILADCKIFRSPVYSYSPLVVSVFPALFVWLELASIVEAKVVSLENLALLARLSLKDFCYSLQTPTVENITLFVELICF